MIEELAGTEVLLVASDFDGTLAEIVDDPDAVEPVARSIAALASLAEMPDTTVAIVSGRRRSDLVRLLGDEPFLLIGEHGADSGDAGTVPDPVLEEARRHVDMAVESTPGSHAEHKTHSAVFHYRTADDPTPALETLRTAAGDMGLRVLEGKSVLELSAASTDKGKAIMGLKGEIGAGATIYIGDDVTDETVFEVMGQTDLGVYVGTGHTAADMTLADPAAVAEWLETLADAREARTT